MKHPRWQRPLFKSLVFLYILPCAALLLPFVKAGVLSLLESSLELETIFWAAYLNTIILAVGNLLLQWLVNIPAGLALSKMLPQHIARKVLYLCLLLMFLPQQALILPQYLLLDRMHLLHHAGGVVLMSAFQPFLVLIFWFGSEKIHPSLFEAAICEGASTRQCFFRIYIPMLSPYILAGSLLSVAESWNMLEQPMTFLQTDSQLVLSTYFLQQIGADPSVTAIQALLSVFPLLLVFAFAVAKLHNPNSIPLTGARFDRAAGGVIR